MERERAEEERRSKQDSSKPQQENQGWSFNSFFGGSKAKQPEDTANTNKPPELPQRPQPQPPQNTQTSTQNANRHATMTPSVTNQLQRVPNTVTPKSHVQRSENEDFQMELICELLESYFKIVKKTVKDRVPKTIMHFLVNKSKEEIQNVLVQELYKEDLLESLLQESDDIAQRREQISQNIAILTSAQRILNEIIDFKV